MAQKPITFNPDISYTIELPSHPTEVQVLAADQLTLYLSPLGFNVSQSSTLPGKHNIFIGRSKPTEKLYQQYGSQIRDDGFLLHTDGRNLYILGLQGKSELYGVYHLLENYFDMTKTDKGSEGIFIFSTPKQRTLCLHDLQNPSFRYRETLYNLPNEAAGYADWHKLACREDFNKDWGLFVHTFQKLVPVDRYFDQHPEYPEDSPMFGHGSPHGQDVAFVFQHMDKCERPEADRPLSDIMGQYWINFAKYGDPNGKGLPVWPAFNNQNPKTMHLSGPTPYADNVPSESALKVLDEYFSWRRTAEGKAWAK